MTSHSSFASLQALGFAGDDGSGVSRNGVSQQHPYFSRDLTSQFYCRPHGSLSTFLFDCFLKASFVDACQMARTSPLIEMHTVCCAGAPSGASVIYFLRSNPSRNPNEPESAHTHVWSNYIICNICREARPREQNFTNEHPQRRLEPSL